MIGELVVDSSTRVGAALQGWSRPATIPQIVAQLADEALINLVIGLGHEKGQKTTPFHAGMPWADDDQTARPSASAGELEAAQAALDSVSVFNN